MNWLQSFLIRRGWQLTRIPEHPPAALLLKTFTHDLDPAELGGCDYAEAAVNTYTRLVFMYGLHPQTAGQLVTAAVAVHGFAGRIDFGYSDNNMANLGGPFTGPFMRVDNGPDTAFPQQVHILPLAVSPADLVWIDGIVDDDEGELV